MGRAGALIVHYAGANEMVPTYASENASGADLKAYIPHPLIVEPRHRVLIPTGIRLAIPQGWEGQVRPRSGLAWNSGLTLLNSPGTIDADYRGEIKVIMINLGDEAVQIEPGHRIAQLVIVEVPRVSFQYTDTLDDTSRGALGFGSTGT